MSDVPDLDRLLEEHAIFRTNMDWHRRDQTAVFIMRCALSFFFLFFACAVFRWWGLLLLPIVWAAVAQFMPMPVLRDPFRRYMRK